MASRYLYVSVFVLIAPFGTMPGQWVVEFDIAANGKKDTAAFSLC